MALSEDKINEIIKGFIVRLKQEIPIKGVILFGSYAQGKPKEYSDIDLAVFLDQDDLDGFDEDVKLMKLRRNIDMRIEPHTFAKSDFDETNPYIKPKLSDFQPKKKALRVKEFCYY